MLNSYFSADIFIYYHNLGEYGMEHMHDKTICILLPALNEAETIGAVIDRIPLEQIKAQGYEVNVVVVDGNSTDATGDIAISKGARLLKQKGKGKGDAVQTAFEGFEGRFLFMLDADDTYDPEEILTMIPLLENGCDVVLGSRLNGSVQRGAMSTLNYVGNRAINMTANLLFPNGHKASDVCTGLWGFKEEVIDNLDLDADDFDIEAEMYTKCIKNGFKVVEIPIAYKCRPNETKLNSFSDGARIMFRLLKERVRDNN